MSRNTTKPVQMPGGSNEATDQTPASAPADLEAAQAAQGAAAVKTDDGTQTTDNSAELEQLRAQLAAANETAAKAQAEAEQLRKAKGGKGAAAAEPAAGRSYRDVPAREIDPSTLSAPVLSRDGWVVPPPPPTTDLRRL